MNNADWQKVETIIDQALDLPMEERSAFVEEKCAGNIQLKGEVTVLLESIFDSEGWLENPGDYKENIYKEISNDVQLLSSQNSLIDKQVGSYIIQQQIGEGGMGTIYLAQRSDAEFEHEVAIKIIRQGQATETNIKRFKREQHILANLNHPGIAKLFDGGITSDGSPYIIMEYVNGMPINAYCKEHNSSINVKVALFEQVLEAMRHAHENLVIHRDLKPGNILVDQAGTIKILDFGISKLLEDNKSDIITRTNARLLTPRYAAPEQIRQENITTATDLYSLGMVFYELLAGAGPFELNERSHYELEQTILKEEPTKPSTKTSSLSDRKKLRGDLDAIALKSIRKEPQQRYRVANEFLEDLHHYNQGLPVTAHEDSWKYRSQKFIKRHVQGIAITTGILLLISGLVTFYTWRVAQERNLAESEAKRAEQVKDFMLSIFTSSNPRLVQYSVPDLKATQLLESGIAKVENDLQNQPETYIEMMVAIGSALTNLDDYENAEIALLRALNKSKSFYGDGPKTAAGYSHLALLMNDQKKTKKAAQYISEAISMVENENGNNDYQLAHYSSIFAHTTAINGQYREAKKMYLKADSLYITSGNRENLYRYNTLDNLAEVEQRLDKYKPAERHMKQALKFYQAYYDGPSLNIASSQFSLGALYSAIGKYKMANKYLLQAVETNKELLGEESSIISTTYASIALNYLYMRDIDNAFLYARRDQKITEELHGKNSLPYARALNNLALIQNTNKAFNAARKTYEEALHIKEQLLDPTHPSLAVAYYNYGNVLKEMGEYKDAAKYVRKALEIDEQTYGLESVDIAIDNTQLASILTYTGNYTEADALFKTSRNIYLKKLPKNHKRVAQNLVEHGKMYLSQGNYKAASQNFEEALYIYNATFSEDDPRIQETEQLLADSKNKWSQT